jgi:hypothetical protein
MQAGKRAQKELLIYSSSYDDSCAGAFYACALQSYDASFFYRKAYSMNFKSVEQYRYLAAPPALAACNSLMRLAISCFIWGTSIWL